MKTTNPRACRHLGIRFLETGDVEYSFFKHHYELMMYRYLIEWPADLVVIKGGQCLEEHGYRKSVTPEGFLQLEWDKISEAETRLGRGVQYIKRNYLRQISEGPTLWRYSERFNVKPFLSIWLHSPWHRLNAVQCRSRARFIGDAGHEEYFRPRELAYHVFREDGILEVAWILEVLDKPRER